MKAPEKLYIGRRNYGPLIGGWKSQPFTSKEIESIEYIRKDALIEWAKDHQEGERQGSYTWSCYQIFIDKLNSIK